jgi:prevent-host-death family protein
MGIHGRIDNGSRKRSGSQVWKLEDAKARFSELVRRAQSDGPQRVTVRGKEAVVVMSVADLEKIAPDTEREPLITFLEGLSLDGLGVTREPDFGRDLVL